MMAGVEADVMVYVHVLFHHLRGHDQSPVQIKNPLGVNI
jgi:hypothetical protein